MGEPFLFFILITGFTFVIASIIWFAVDLRKAKKLLQIAETEKSELRSIISDAEIMVNELNNFSNLLLEKIDIKNNEAGAFISKLDDSICSARISLGDLHISKYIDALVDNESDGVAKAEAVEHLLAEAADGAIDEDDDEVDDEEDDEEDDEVDDEIDDEIDDENSLEDVEKIVEEIVEEAVEGIVDIEADEIVDEVVENVVGRISEDAVDAEIETTNNDAAPLIIFPYHEKRIIYPYQSKRNSVMMTKGRKYIEVTNRLDEGMDEASIAKTLNIGRGEVELILGLRNSNYSR